MEKYGIIKPGVTPPETLSDEKTAVDRLSSVQNDVDAKLKAIRELDGDFRKLAANVVKDTL